MQNGYQISHELLQRAIAIDQNCNLEDVKVQTISKSTGSNKGENFTCVLFALQVEATLLKEEEQAKTFHYMAKCLPANEHRAKFLTEVILYWTQWNVLPNFKSVEFEAKMCRN